MSTPLHQWGTGSRRALFLHGFLGTERSFDHLAPLLGDEVTASCPLLPGHGDAKLPAEEGAAGFLATVDALAQLIDTPQIVVGYSQGARLALCLAIRHREKVSRLVLESCHPGHRQRSERLRRRKGDDERSAQLLTHGLERFVDDWQALSLFDGLRRLPAADWQALRLRRLSHRPEGLSGALRTLGQGVQPDCWPALPALRIPTLVLTGALDTKYARIAKKMVGELPMAWRRVFEGVGHSPHLEVPQAYADELRGFFDTELSE